MEASASGDAAISYDRAAALEELAAVETNLRTLLEVYRQRLEREGEATATGSEEQEGPKADQQAAAAAAAALPELQHHATAFLASAKALDDQFAALQAAGGETAASVSQEIEQLKVELAEKDVLLGKQADNLVKWQMLFAKLAADATAMADDPEA